MPSSLPHSVRLGSDAYRDLLEGIGLRIEAREGASLMLTGAREQDAQQLLADLAEYTSLSVHQFDVDQLVGERGIETQGNLREAFDSTSGEAAVLFLDHVDVLVREVPSPEEAPQAETPGKDDDTLRPVDYLLDRVDAQPGLVVLHLADASLISRFAADVDVVIEARGGVG